MSMRAAETRRPWHVVCKNFRPSLAPSLGVELELQLVDSRSMALRCAIDDVLVRLPGCLRNSVKPEYYRSCVEINTSICDSVEEVRKDLIAKLRLVEQAARRCGLSLAWAGTHPFSHWRDQRVMPTARYFELTSVFRETLGRQLIFGLHVHVGVISGDTAIRVCNKIREYLPLLLALSANSPFWCGRATGLLAHRAEVISALPASGPPPPFGDWAGYAALVERLISGRCIRTPRDLWWDVRPSPSQGTVEVRICDMPQDLPSVLALTVLIQCLVTFLSRESTSVAEDAGFEVTIRHNRWRAARYGLGADFFDPRTGRLIRAQDQIDALVERLFPVANELGCREGLERVRMMAQEPTGAERQLVVYEQSGDLRGVVRSRIAGNLCEPLQLIRSPDTPHQIRGAVSADAACSDRRIPGCTGSWT
jgi:carboxylate-amine ligase